jgi:hypothetical protein
MFTEDLSVFVSTDDFAVAAKFAGAQIEGIFQAPYAEALGVAGVSPTFRCVETDVPSAVGKTIEIFLAAGARTYSIVNALPDGTGMTVLVLEG